MPDFPAEWPRGKQRLAPAAPVPAPVTPGRRQNEAGLTRAAPPRPALWRPSPPSNPDPHGPRRSTGAFALSSRPRESRGRVGVPSSSPSPRRAQRVPKSRRRSRATPPGGQAPALPARACCGRGVPAAGVRRGSGSCSARARAHQPDRPQSHPPASGGAERRPVLTAARIQRRRERLTARGSRVQGGGAPRECRGAASRARGPAGRGGSEGRGGRRSDLGARGAHGAAGRSELPGACRGASAGDRLRGRGSRGPGVRASVRAEPGRAGAGLCPSARAPRGCHVVPLGLPPAPPHHPAPPEGPGTHRCGGPGLPPRDVPEKAATA